MSNTPGASPAPSLVIRIGNFFFRYRNGLFPVLFVLVLMVPPALFGGSRRFDEVAVGVGAFLALLGESVRCATIGLVYVKRGGKSRRIYASSLITEGIYAHTRNPMYLGNLLIAGGVCLIYGSPWMDAGALSFFLAVYLSITVAEERYLRGRFGGEYTTYCRNTNRFWPRMKGLPRTLGRHRFDWRKVVNKEHGTLFGLFMGLYFVLLWKYYRVYAQSPIPAHPLRLVLPVIPLATLYGAARWLKKTHRV